MTYKERLKRDINLLEEENGIREEDLKYFKLLYADLDEKELLTKMALVNVSYSLIKNISYRERALFVEGMSSYIELTKMTINDVDFNKASDEYKKELVMNWAKEDFNTEIIPLMFEEGVNSAIRMVNQVEKDVKQSKTRKRN